MGSSHLMLKKLQFAPALRNGPQARIKPSPHWCDRVLSPPLGQDPYPSREIRLVIKLHLLVFMTSSVSFSTCATSSLESFLSPSATFWMLLIVGFKLSVKIPKRTSLTKCFFPWLSPFEKKQWKSWYVSTLYVHINIHVRSRDQAGLLKRKQADRY